MQRFATALATTPDPLVCALLRKDTAGYFSLSESTGSGRLTFGTNAAQESAEARPRSESPVQGAVGTATRILPYAAREPSMVCSRQLSDSPPFSCGHHRGSSVNCLWMGNSRPQPPRAGLPSPRTPVNYLCMKHPVNYAHYPAVLSVSEARARGASEYDVRSGRGFPPATWGIRFDGSVSTEFPIPTWADDAWIDEAQLLTAIVYRHPGVVACRETAARLFGWPLPSSLRSDILHLGTSEINKRIRRRGITLHRMRTLRSIEWLKLPVLNPLQVFSQLASVCSVESLVKVGDAAIGNWKSPPQFTLATLTEHISETKHLRARPKLEAAVDLIREDVDSPMETDLRLWAISRNLPEPEVHPAVYCPTIDRTLHPDLGYPKKKLALEYEGDHHRISEYQWAADIDRVNALRAAGWTVIRVTKSTSRQQLERDIRHHLGLQ